MQSSSSKPMFPNVIIFILIFTFIFKLTFSFPTQTTLNTNTTLFGDAYFAINNTSNTSFIILTHQKQFSAGRAFYNNPFKFLDPLTNSSVSFSSRFSFMITPSSTSNHADGIAFLITSNTGLFSPKFGHLGMPKLSLNSHDRFFAVEFDTKFDTLNGDINGNHVGIDVNSYTSLVSVDGFSSGVDFSDGKRINVWIQYRDSVKKIKVWVSYFPNKPLNPILSAEIDLSKYVKESMYVGFSASNGDGSALHVIDQWEFKTFEFDYAFVDKEEEVSNNVRSKKGNKKQLITLFGVTISFNLLLVIVVICYWWRLRNDKVSKLDKGRRIELDKGPVKLSLVEIEVATSSFSKSRIIGQGASATVYKGILFDEQVVAVKRFNNISRGNLDKPFTTEFATMAQRLKHENLVQLLGWCCENKECVLVYEFLPNGSLDQILHKNSDALCVLTGEQRLNIVLGIASCLRYLHEECNKKIIHRDVKTCNVMLDSDFTPKLGDFGSAEVYDRDSRARKPTIPAGTMGYLAPEYVYSGVPTVKSDVYSFGVVVLEVVSGRRPVVDNRDLLVDWVWSLWENGKLIEAVDERMMGKYSSADMERMLKVGLCCVHSDKKKRPTMKEAAMMLKEELQVPVLPAKKPIMKIQGAIVPRASRKSLSTRVDDLDECPWSTPRTHFSEV
ncbi:L-type lectin-domain containing receptor kinase S.6 [Beta vulgaris subsp. vulgaris]|uniref:L-type lectin-domain containing receptor kinase S.6 n=1 Tax=Beta vulgaris subsp. vulgaris TaxID=3555 RepID=UPI00203670D2|nr:L-type lectin-domain containing receptor kinase S.6 [Beta vulgaris subsp. vulgaris]